MFNDVLCNNGYEFFKITLIPNIDRYNQYNYEAF